MTNQINCVGCDESPGSILMQSSVLLSKMFEEVTGIKVHLCYTICKSCQTELRSCYNFRKRCHEIFTLYNTEEPEPEVSPPEEPPEELEKYQIESLKSENEIEIESIEETLISDDEIHTIETYEPPESSDDQISVPESEDHKKFQCEICPKTFIKRSHLVAHQSSHENLRLYQCSREGCSSSFNVSTRLIRHLRNVHEADEEEIAEIRDQLKDLKPKKSQTPKEKVPQGKVQCEICNKVLSNTRYLMEHMTLQHLKNSKYVCKEPGCKKRFKIWSLLERHMKKHNGQVDFVCKFCGKGYVERKVFNSHLRKVHQISQTEIDKMRWSTNGTETGGSKCRDCGQEFKIPSKLFYHRALEHGDGERFICDMCGKVFTSKAFLVSHQKYHRGVKNKKCLKCPSIFTEDKGLRTHLRRVHKMDERELLALQMEGKL